MQTKSKAEKPPMKLSGIAEFNDKFIHLQERAKRIAESQETMSRSETDSSSRAESPTGSLVPMLGKA